MDGGVTLFAHTQLRSSTRPKPCRLLFHNSELNSAACLPHFKKRQKTQSDFIRNQFLQVHTRGFCLKFNKVFGDIQLLGPALLRHYEV